VAELGLLFELYALGTMAYVGGGFDPRRLHAVAEPAVWGVPVIVGPRAGTSDDVRALVARGGAVVLPPRDPAAALAARWRSWLDEHSQRQAAGLAARSFLQSRAAGRTAGVLRELITVRR
jgi:3-deoxy-D-manno-octulosonic-acid transferase